VVGGLVLLLTQLPKPKKSIHVGFLHSMLTALVAGIALVGINSSLHATDPVQYDAPDHAVVGIKFLILLVILGLTIKNKKKWIEMLGKYKMMIIIMETIIKKMIKIINILLVFNSKDALAALQKR
jgi:hypothetical protein